MSNSDLLLDANAAIALLNGDKAISLKLPSAARVFLSVVALAELIYGAEKSNRRQENLSKVDQFSASLPLLPCGPATARVYAQARNALRIKGKPIPSNDIWIAASAIEHGLALVTRDSHFQQIDGLTIITW